MRPLAKQPPKPSPGGLPARGGPRGKKLRRTGFLGWLRDVAGHATTETVIMMPVFIAIWGGIWYTHGRYRKAVNMAQFTRGHVWAHAFNGCDGDPNSGRTNIGDRGSDDRTGFIDGVMGLMFSGAVPGFAFDEIEGTRETSIERPTVLGEGAVNMGYNVVVLCNERTQNQDSFLGVAADMFLPW